MLCSRTKWLLRQAAANLRSLWFHILAPPFITSSCIWGYWFCSPEFWCYFFVQWRGCWDEKMDVKHSARQLDYPPVCIVEPPLASGSPGGSRPVLWGELLRPGIVGGRARGSRRVVYQLPC